MTTPTSRVLVLGGTGKTGSRPTAKLTGHGSAIKPQGASPVVDNIEDFRALDPFFGIIEEGLREYVDGDHFFDLLAEDVVFEFVITVPDYPHNVVGRGSVIELYRGYGATFSLDRCYDLRVHYSEATSSAVLEYSSAGRVVATGFPYSNRYISVVAIKDRKVAGWRDYLDPLRVFAALEGRPFEPDGAEANVMHETGHSLSRDSEHIV